MKAHIVVNKTLSSFDIKNSIKEIVKDNGYNSDLSDVICNLFDYMEQKKLYGGCFALSSVLYVAVSELCYDCKIIVGECKNSGMKPFDHSWITIDDKIVDLAIYYPLTQIINSVSAPIILNKEVVTNKHVYVEYGINTGLMLSDDLQKVIYTPFNDYMSNYPNDANGLWGVLREIMPKHYRCDINMLKDIYKDTQRVLIR